jgi:RNA polymerase sigma-70 factor (ECF subfamily)
VTPPETPPSSDAPESPAPADERELIQRCLAGDVSAFEPLVERYRQRVWRLAYQVLRDKEEAWDCAQEAFVRAFHSLPAFRGQSAFYTWLFRITVNVATDRQRARGAQARAFGAERVPEEEWRRTTPDPGGGPDRAAIQAEQRERIERALDALPPKARAIIMLSDVEGLSYREIAEVLRCPIGTVMSRLHNARKRLKSLLGPVLAVLLSLLTSLAAPVARVEAQPVIRFGVRVLQASNPIQDPSQPPAARVRPPASPSPGLPPPPPPQAVPAPGPPIAGAPGSPVSPPPPHDNDRPLDRILPHLRQLFRYADYVSLDRHRFEGPLGVMQRVSIPGDRSLEVTPDRMQGTSVRMHVRLLRGEQAEVNASLLAAPGAPAIFGGPPYGNGVLIIILWAAPVPPPGGPPGWPFRSRPHE